MAYNQKLREQAIEEYVLSLKTDRTLYLVGTANRGAVNIPVEIQSVAQLKHHFGTEGTLIEAYRQIQYLLPKRNVFLVKASGEHATCSLNVNQEEIEKGAFQIISKHANEESNEIVIELDPCYLHIVHPESMGGHRVSYDLRKYGTMGDLVYAINEDSKQGAHEICVSCSYEEWVLDYPFYACNPSQVKLSGGHSHLAPTLNEWFECLEATYATLEGLKIDLIIPIKAYLDSSKTIFSKYHESFYELNHYQAKRDYLTLPKACFFEQLQTFCQLQQTLGIFTHGVMGLHPGLKEDEMNYLQYLKHLSQQFNNSLDMVESHCLISVVETEVYYDYFQSNDSGYLAYGALLLNLEISANPTNELIGESVQLVNELSVAGQAEASNLGFVCFRYSPFKEGNVVKVGVTFTSKESGLRYFHNLQMCQLTCQVIKKTVDYHVGSNLNEMEENQYLETELAYLFEMMIEQKILDSYSLSIEYSIERGSVEVDISIKTRYMVESVNVSGSLVYQYM